MEHVNNAVRQVWEQSGGARPDQILIRPNLLLAKRSESGQHDAPVSRLLNSRGIALRFYLLALFEAQCRPVPWDRHRAGNRPLSGIGGWGDLIAVDAAWSQPVKTYQRRTKQERDLDSSRERQVKSAMRTLETPGDQGLVWIPRKANGKDRNYGSFRLMKESGRGDKPTPEYYSPPAWQRGVFGVPAGFFLRGWVQVLYPSEIATWLALRLLASIFPGKHRESGVYLYGQDRKKHFNLHRDAYEDGCRSLTEFELVRPAQPVCPAAGKTPEAPDFAQLWAMAAESGQKRYEANRYQLVDDGLNKDALRVVMAQLQGRRT